MGGGGKREDLAQARGRSALPGLLSGRAEDRVGGRPDSLSQPDGRANPQLLARSGAPARHLALDHRCRLRDRRSALDDAARCGRAGQGRGQELGVQGRDMPPARGTLLPRQPVGRRRGCRQRARIRSADRAIRRRRLQPAQIEAGRRLDRSRHDPGVARLGRGHDDPIGLSVRPESAQARAAARVRDRSLSWRAQRSERNRRHDADRRQGPPRDDNLSLQDLFRLGQAAADSQGRGGAADPGEIHADRHDRRPCGLPDQRGLDHGRQDGSGRRARFGVARRYGGWRRVVADRDLPARPAPIDRRRFGDQGQAAGRLFG